MATRDDLSHTGQEKGSSPNGKNGSHPTTQPGSWLREVTLVIQDRRRAAHPMAENGSHPLLQPGLDPGEADPGHIFYSGEELTDTVF